jgi:Sec-independent protein translocase protein TatA
MDFLGVGPLELIFIMIIALIIFGPNDIVRAGRTVGSFLRRLITSDSWKAFQQARKGISDLPTTLMREAGIEEEELRQLSGMSDLQNATQDLENQISPWTTPPLKTPENPVNPSETSDTENNPTESNVDEASKEPPTPPPGSPFSRTIEDDE